MLKFCKAAILKTIWRASILAVFLTIGGFAAYLLKLSLQKSLKIAYKIISNLQPYTA